MAKYHASVIIFQCIWSPLHCKSNIDTLDLFFVSGGSNKWTLNSHDEVNQASLFGYDAPKKREFVSSITGDCDIELKLYLSRFSVDSW